MNSVLRQNSMLWRVNSTTTTSWTDKYMVVCTLKTNYSKIMMRRVLAWRHWNNANKSNVFVWRAKFICIQFCCVYLKWIWNCVYLKYNDFERGKIWDNASSIIKCLFSFSNKLISHVKWVNLNREKKRQTLTYWMWFDNLWFLCERIHGIPYRCCPDGMCV